MGTEPTAPPGPRRGSPFAPGRPLRPGETLFGRGDALRFLGDNLADACVAVVGERRTGRTSLLLHLAARYGEYLPPSHPPGALLVAYLDCQANVTAAPRFYALALRGLLDQLTGDLDLPGYDRDDDAGGARLREGDGAGYDAFDRLLEALAGAGVRPVLLLDEFECLLDPALRGGFAFPAFFNGLRALITAGRLGMVAAVRRPLVDYFRDRNWPWKLTSSFASYFLPTYLGGLDAGATDALLLQESDRPLTPRQAAIARRWAGGHPCLLQAAGQAWYEALGRGEGERWARRRFDEYRAQCCAAGREGDVRTHSAYGRRRRAVAAVFWGVPVRVGRLIQRLGGRLDEYAAWWMGFAFLVVLVLVVAGLLPWSDILHLVRGFLGLGGPSG